MRQFRRHDRQACKREMLNRNYVLDGKIVARNRHKTFGQKDDSPEEYVEAGGRTDKRRQDGQTYSKTYQEGHEGHGEALPREPDSPWRLYQDSAEARRRLLLVR